MEAPKWLLSWKTWEEVECGPEPEHSGESTSLTHSQHGFDPWHHIGSLEHCQVQSQEEVLSTTRCDPNI